MIQIKFHTISVKTNFGSLQLSIMWGRESLSASTECRSHQHFKLSASGRRSKASCNSESYYLDNFGSCAYQFPTSSKLHLKLSGLVHRGGHKREMARFPGINGCIEGVSDFLLFSPSSASCTIHFFTASLLRGFKVSLFGTCYYGRACANYVGGSKRAPPLCDRLTELVMVIIRARARRHFLKQVKGHYESM